MAEKISISEIYDPGENFPPYVNMTYDIQTYSNHFCNSQTYNLPGVYLSNLLIYDTNKLKSTLSIGQKSGYVVGNLKYLFMLGNNGNEDSFINSSNINFYRYLNYQKNSFIDSLFYDTSIDCTRCNLPLYTSEVQNNKKLIKIDNNFKVVPFPFFYPRPIDCILMRLNDCDCYTISLHDSNKMSFDDPSLTLNSVSYSKADKNNYRVYTQNEALIVLQEPTKYSYTKILYSRIGFTKYYNIYYSDDKIYCNFYFYLLNDFLPDNSPYVNTSSHPMGTHYDGPTLKSGYVFTELGLNFQLIYERKFILSNDNYVYITGSSLLPYVSLALGSNYTDIHVYFTEINKSSTTWFYPRLSGAVGTIAKFLSINSASARGSEAHRFNDNAYNEYIHLFIGNNENNVTYTSMFIVAVAKNTISQKYQLILVGIFTLNNLIYKISSNVSTSSLDTYPIKTLKPSEAMDIYKYPVISEDNYDHITDAQQFFNNDQLYPISTDIGGCSYYYEDDGPTPKVCKIARRELTLSSVLWKHGHYTDNISYKPLGENNYIFSCMTTIPFYEFNFNAYEYGESYGYSY